MKDTGQTCLHSYAALAFVVSDVVFSILLRRFVLKSIVFSPMKHSNEHSFANTASKTS